MKEILFKSGTVVVTSKTLEVGNNIYHNKNISLIKTAYESPKKGWGYFLICVGIFIGLLPMGIAIAGDGNILFGLINLILGVIPGILILIFTKEKYYVEITYAGKKMNVAQSKDRKDIDKIVNIVNDNLSN